MKIAIIGSGYVGRFIYRLLESEHSCDIYQFETTKDISKKHGHINSKNGSYHVWGGVLALPDVRNSLEYGINASSITYLMNFIVNNLKIERLYNFHDENISFSAKINDKISIKEIKELTVRKILKRNDKYWIEKDSYDEIIIATGSYSKPVLEYDNYQPYISFITPEKVNDKVIYIRERACNDWETRIHFKDGGFEYSIPIQLPIDNCDIPFIYNHIYMRLKNFKDINWIYYILNLYKYFKIGYYKSIGRFGSYYFSTTNIVKKNTKYMKAYHYDISEFVDKKLLDNYITEYSNQNFTYLNPVSFRLLNIINKLIERGIIK